MSKPKQLYSACRFNKETMSKKQCFFKFVFNILKKFNFVTLLKFSP